MGIDNVRHELSEKAINTWWDINLGYGTVVAPTGSGKNFMAFNAITRLPVGSDILFLFERTERKITITDEVYKYEELFKYNLFDHYNISFATYQSAYKWKHAHYDLVICDEVHEIMTPTYSKFFVNNYYNNVLGLTATTSVNTYYANGKRKSDYFDKYCPVIFEYTTEEAQKNKVQREIKIHVINIELDDTRKVIKAGTKQKPFLTTEKKNYTFWNKRFNDAMGMEPLDEKEFAQKDRNIRTSAKKRAHILYNLPMKILIVKRLLQLLNNNKVLIFGNSLDSLEAMVGPHRVISSRLSKKKRDMIFKALSKEAWQTRLRHFASFKMLEQGVNIPDLEFVILASYYGKSRPLIQRIGRLRKDGTKIGHVIILRTRNTVEEEWFKRMFEGVNGYAFVEYEGIDKFISDFDKRGR